jgi:hypothetical protein
MDYIEIVECQRSISGTVWRRRHRRKPNEPGDFFSSQPTEFGKLAEQRVDRHRADAFEAAQELGGFGKFGGIPSPAPPIRARPQPAVSLGWLSPFCQE